MMNNIPTAPFSIAGRIRSFGYAINGVYFLARTQHNAWLHLAATCLVVLFAILLEIANSDWVLLVLAVTLVWFAEAMNTAFEHLCDVVCPQYSVSVQYAKDIAAGAVLICACGAVVLGLIVFLPYLLGR